MRISESDCERILIRIELRGKIDIMDTVAFLVKIIIELKHISRVFGSAKLKSATFLSAFVSSFAVSFPVSCSPATPIVLPINELEQSIIKRLQKFLKIL